MSNPDEPFIKFRELPDDINIFPNEKNFIKTMISHPCARPWYVWVETFVPAFLKLLLTVSIFDVEDAIRAHGESIVRDRQRGKSKRHAPKVRLAGAGRAVTRYAQQALKTLLVVTKPLENIGFLWLLYSATDEFFFDWQTLLEESTFCKQPIISGPMQRSRGPGFISFTVGGATIIMTNALQNRGGWANNVFGVTLPQGSFTAGLGLTVKAPLSGVSPIWIGLRVVSFFGVTNFRSDNISILPGEEASMSLVARFFLPFSGGGTMTWEVGGSTIPAGIESVSGHVFVQRRG